MSKIHYWREEEKQKYIYRNSRLLNSSLSIYLSMFFFLQEHAIVTRPYKLAQLASADISWLRGIWKSPWWWTSHAAVHQGVCLSVYFRALVCVPILHKHSLANVMQLSKAQPCKPIQLINSCAQPSRCKKKTLQGTGGDRQPSQMFNIRPLVSPPHYEVQTSETNNKC